MTDQERLLLDMTADLWNTFLRLPVEHPDAVDEFRHALHDLQRQIMARPVMRQMREQMRES